MNTDEEFMEQLEKFKNYIIQSEEGQMSFELKELLQDLL